MGNYWKCRISNCCRIFPEIGISCCSYCIVLDMDSLSKCLQPCLKPFEILTAVWLDHGTFNFLTKWVYEELLRSHVLITLDLARSVPHVQFKSRKACRRRPFGIYSPRRCLFWFFSGLRVTMAFSEIYV